MIKKLNFLQFEVFFRVGLVGHFFRRFSSLISEMVYFGPQKNIRKKNYIAKSWIWTCAFSGWSKFCVRITKCAEKFDGFSNFSRWAHHGSRFSYVSKWPEKWGEFTSIGHFWRILEEQVEILEKKYFFRANQRLPMKRGQIRTL